MTLTLTQWILIVGFALIYAGQIASHFSHSKKIQAIGKDVAAVGEKIEQNAPAIAKAVIATGLVQEVKQEPPK